MDLRKATCSECKSHLHYMENMSVKKNGVTMHFGDRFCMGGKKPRKFGRGDPGIYVPTWCPKRKVPSELRIYGFKSVEQWMLHHDMCEQLRAADLLAAGARHRRAELSRGRGGGVAGVPGGQVETARLLDRRALWRGGAAVRRARRARGGGNPRADAVASELCSDPRAAVPEAGRAAHQP